MSAPSAAADPENFDLQSHRGGRGETTEESLRAFAKSLELGVSTLEFDIVITKDAQPLVWHDPTIDPTKCADTGPAFPGDPQYPYVGKLVHDLTLAQIRTLDCGKRLDNFPGAEVVPDNKIATLPEVFALADSYRAEVRYNIETKVEAGKPETSASPAEFVDVILPVIRSAGKIDRGRDPELRLAYVAVGASGRAVDPAGGLVGRDDVGPGLAVAGGGESGRRRRPDHRRNNAGRQHPVARLFGAVRADTDGSGLCARRRQSLR